MNRIAGASAHEPDCRHQLLHKKRCFLGEATFFMIWSNKIAFFYVICSLSAAEATFNSKIKKSAAFTFLKRN